MRTDQQLAVSTPPKLSVLIGILMQWSKSFTDIHIESNSAIMLRTSAGDWIQALDSSDQPIVVSHQSILAFVNSIYTGHEEVRSHQSAAPAWEKQFYEVGSLHPAYVILSRLPDGGTKKHRVRCTIQRQNMGDSIGLVVRALHDVPASFESLGLPFQVGRMLTSTSGLIVITGPTGSGKSTTLAAMLESINRTRSNNILTIEDPIEFEFKRNRSLINQRELYVDVPSFEMGVRDALRFVPDVIMVGETRDDKTMRAVLRAAESGHLVLTSMHAPTAVAAARKMLAYLNSAADAQALAGCLVGIVAQGLVQTVAGKSDPNKLANCLAYEVLNCKDAFVQQTIMSAARGSGDLSKIDEKLRTDSIENSVPMIKSLRNMVKSGLVEAAKAASVAVDVEDRAEFLRMGASAAPEMAKSFA